MGSKYFLPIFLHSQDESLAWQVEAVAKETQRPVLARLAELRAVVERWQAKIALPV